MSIYFKKIKSYEELKEQYKKLLKTHHPDNGGDSEIMKEINVEYDALFPIWKQRRETEMGRQVDETAESTRSQFYTEFGWEGRNHSWSRTLKDVANIVRAYVKEKYPAYKFSVRTSSASMCQKLHVELKESPVGIYKTFEELTDEDKHTLVRRAMSNGYFSLASWKTEEELKAELERIWTKHGDFYKSLNEVTLKVVKDVDAFVDSYNYKDIDSMDDYHNVDFYYFGCCENNGKSIKVVPKTARLKEPSNELKKAYKQPEEAQPAARPGQDAPSGYTYEITKDKDTRDGSELWLVRIKEKLAREAYLSQKKMMETYGGFYNRFHHAFVFRHDPSEELGIYAKDVDERSLRKLGKTRELMKAVDAYYREHNTLEGCPYLSPEEIEIISYGAEPSPSKDVQSSSSVELHTGRLLVDMDGTLAKFQVVDTLETLYEEGYYLNLEPMEQVVEAVREIKNNHPEIEVYIMSAVLSDSKYALAEKNQWLDKHLPEIDMEHRIFPPCGENKLEYVPEGIRETDCLLDDYTHNLMLWEPPAKGIKLLNGINHTHETWTGNCLRHDQPPQELAEKIVDIVEKGAAIREEKPLHQQAALANRNHQQTSGYLTEKEWDGLLFLTEVQALKAFESGIHICAVNSFPEYHGIHKDDYFSRELITSREVEKLYHGFESGIHHKAYISPGYDNVQGLYEAVKEECLRDRVSADIKPKPAEPAVRGPRL